MVLEGRSVPADEAVRIHAVDFLADDLDDLLRKADPPLAGAEVDEHDMGLLRRIQQRLADPNLTFLFLSLGTLALMFELAAPGIAGPGITGIVLLLLALFGLAVLPVDVVGLLLLLAAAVLFVLELLAPGVGVAAVGGTVALALGGVFLFDDESGLGVSLAVLVPLAAVVGGGVVLAGRLAVRSRNAPSTLTGPGSIVGREATLKRGQVFVEGAWWGVRSTDPPLEEDTRVRVVDVDGLELVVEPIGQREEKQP
jgi:membrane-bound serine protease (ClpP class)